MADLNKDKWSALSMKDRALYIKLAVSKGLRNLDDIRLLYNSFEDGGDTNLPEGSYRLNESVLLIPEIYVTPYGNFNSTTHPMLSSLMDRMREYDEVNPLIGDELDRVRINSVDSNGKVGRLHGAEISPEWIEYATTSAIKGGHDPRLAVALMSRETTIGNDTDGPTTAKIWGSKTIKALLDAGVDPYKTELHIGLPFQIAEGRRKYREDNIDEYPYSLSSLNYRYNNIIGNHDHYDNLFPYYRMYDEAINNVGLDRNAIESYLKEHYTEQDLSNSPTNPIIDALDYYATGNYNRGWKGLYPAVQRDYKEVSNNPLIMEIINEAASKANNPWIPLTNEYSIGGSIIKANLNHQYGGTTESALQMLIGLPTLGLNVNNGWKPYTTELIIDNAEKINLLELAREALMSKIANDYLTTSNDNTIVNNGREYNLHLVDRNIEAAKGHAAWVKEHPNLTAWGNVIGAAPFAVASAPFIGAAGTGITALGDMAAATTVGLGITNFLTPIATTSVAGATVPQWLDLGLTSGFGAHGIQTSIDEGGISPTTALEIAPLGLVARPIYNAGKEELQYAVKATDNAARYVSPSSKVVLETPTTLDDLGKLFDKSKSKGVESKVIVDPNNSNFVLKQSRKGVTLEELDLILQKNEALNNYSFVLPSEYVGAITKEDGLLYPIFRLEKITPYGRNSIWNAKGEMLSDEEIKTLQKESRNITDAVRKQAIDLGLLILNGRILTPNGLILDFGEMHNVGYTADGRPVIFDALLNTAFKMNEVPLVYKAKYK